MGFFNKYPYTDFHELNLDWVLGKIKNLENDFEFFKRNNVSMEEFEMIPEDIEQQYGVFVSQGGVDQVGNGTRENPYGTIEYAIKSEGVKRQDVRVYLLDSGEYDLVYTTLNCNLHLTALVNNVTLNLTTTLRNYASHSTIQSVASDKMKINCNGNSWYFDGHTLFSNVEIDGLIQLSGADLQFNNCNISNVSVTNGFILFRGACKLIEPNNITRSAIYLVNSVCEFMADGTITIDYQHDYPSNYLIYSVFSYISGTTPFEINGTYKPYKCYIHWSNLLMSPQMINKFSEICPDSDINYNIAPEFNVGTQALSVNSTNMAGGQIKCTRNSSNSTYNMKISAQFKSNGSGYQSYTYYTVGNYQVIPMFSGSLNAYGVNDDEVLHLVGYATIEATDTNNNRVFVNVPIVSFKRQNIYHVGIVFARSGYNSLFNLTINSIYSNDDTLN